jgi:MFS family permease
MKKSLILPELALFITSAMLGLSNGMHHTLISVRGGLEDFPLVSMGIIMSLYYFGFLIGSKTASYYIKRVGHIRTFASFASIASAAALLYAMFPNIVFWAVMRLITGVCFAILFVAAESWLHQKATKEVRGQMLAIYMIIQFTAMAFGQFIINIADPLTFDLFVILSVIVSLSLVPLTLTKSPGPNIQESSDLSFKELFNAAPLAFFASLMCGFSNSAFFSMTAIYAADEGIKLTHITWIIIAATIGGLVAQWPVGWFSDTFDRRKITFFITAIAACASASLGVFIGSTPLMLLSAFILGGALLSIYPVAIAIAIDSVESEQILDANAAMQSIYSLGASIGPFAASLFMFMLGNEGFIFWLILTFSITALIAATRATVLPAWEPEEQSDFIALPPATPTPVTLELDERIQEEIEDFYNDE